MKTYLLASLAALALAPTILVLARDHNRFREHQSCPPGELQIDDVAVQCVPPEEACPSVTPGAMTGCCPDDWLPGDISRCGGPVDISPFRMIPKPKSSTTACEIKEPLPKASKTLHGAKLQQAIDSAKLFAAGSVAWDGQVHWWWNEKLSILICKTS